MSLLNFSSYFLFGSYSFLSRKTQIPMCVCVCMSKNLNTWIKEIEASLEQKGCIKDIPLNTFQIEFMIISGYSKNKVTEWVNNFKICKLIDIKDNIVNFK